MSTGQAGDCQGARCAMGDTEEKVEACLTSLDIKHLGKMLYEKMEHLNPTEEMNWDALPAEEQEFYVLCAEEVIFQARCQLSERARRRLGLSAALRSIAHKIWFKLPLGFRCGHPVVVMRQGIQRIWLAGRRRRRF